MNFLPYVCTTYFKKQISTTNTNSVFKTTQAKSNEDKEATKAELISYHNNIVLSVRIDSLYEGHKRRFGVPVLPSRLTYHSVSNWISRNHSAYLK